MGFGVGGWLLIAGTIILGVFNTLTAANEDEAVLREYGFGYAIGLMLLLLNLLPWLIVGAFVWLA